MHAESRGRRGIRVRRRCHGGRHRDGHGHRRGSGLCSTGQSSQQSCCCVEDCKRTRAGHVCCGAGKEQLGALRFEPSLNGYRHRLFFVTMSKKLHLNLQEYVRVRL